MADADERVVAARAMGERVKALREKLGLGVRELGRLAGVSAGQIAKLEKGQKFPDKSQAATLDRLARALQTTPDILRTGVAAAPGREQTYEPDDRYPNRAKAIVHLRAMGVGEGAITWLRSRRLQSLNQDKTVREWVEDGLAHDKLHAQDQGREPGPEDNF